MYRLITELRVISKSGMRILLLLAASLPGLVWAQHTHGVLTPSVTFPQDDAVLREQPRMLTISFRVDVQLLKLALYTNRGEWIDMGFQWDPGAKNHNFVFPIPTELPPADFYVTEWSVVDENRRFMRGAFNFSFGPGAVPPSEIIEASVTSNPNPDGSYPTPFEAFRARQQRLQNDGVQQ
ncbi:MAG: copper resistance protein CopC [Gammaproteobacteria bacterium]